MTPESKKPKYELQVYRDFIRDAAPFISLIAGKKISASEAYTMSEEALTELALRIDDRVADLNKQPPSGGGTH